MSSRLIVLFRRCIHLFFTEHILRVTIDRKIDEIYIHIYISRIHRFRRVSGRRSNDTSRLSRLNSLFNRKRRKRGRGDSTRQSITRIKRYLFIRFAFRSEVRWKLDRDLKRRIFRDFVSVTNRTRPNEPITAYRGPVIDCESFDRSSVHSFLDSFVRSFVLSFARLNDRGATIVVN